MALLHWYSPDEAFDAITKGRAASGIRVKGHLSFEALPVAFELPEHLTVDGDLILTRSRVRALPKGLSIWGALAAEGCADLTAITQDVEAREIRFKNCRALKEVKARLRAGETASFEGCISLATVEGEIRAKEINFDGCRSLLRLPAVRAERIHLTGCERLRVIDPDLVRRALVVVDGRTAVKFQDEMVLSRAWATRLLLTRRLPSGRRVLTLGIQNRADLESLPERTRVIDSLSFQNCPRLTGLPDTLEVGDSLNLIGTTPAIAVSPKVKRKRLTLPDGKTDDTLAADATGCLGTLFLAPYYMAKLAFIFMKAGMRAPAPDAVPHRKGINAEAARQAILAGQTGPLVIEGDLSLDGLPELTEINAPLTVRGSLSFRGLPRLRALRDLRVTGRLAVYNCESLSLFERVTAGSVELSNCPRVEGVDGLRTDNLALTTCRTIAAIADVSPYNHLRISSCPALKAIGGAFCGESLELRELPALETLPSSIDTAALVLGEMPLLRTLPTDLRFQRARFSRVECLESLPPNLIIESLAVSSCPRFKALPPQLLVVEAIEVDGCPDFETIPPETVCYEFKSTGGKVRAIDTKWRALRGLTVRSPLLERLPSTLLFAESLDLNGCTALKRLPPRLTVRSSLDLTDCAALEEVPAQMPPPQRVELGGTRLNGVPGSWQAIPISWHRVPVSARILYQPDRVPPSEVLAEGNLEVRRIMLQRIGFEAFARSVDSVLVDEDRDPGGARRLLRIPTKATQDIFLLNVRCPSTQREYMLRVPPTVTTCHAAAAALAGLPPDRYNPIVET